VDRARIRVAAQLLVKAESTDSEAEAAALTERCYRLLADIITKYDIEQGHTAFGRRRERRFLRDRRGDRKAREEQRGADAGRAQAAQSPEPKRAPASSLASIMNPAARYRNSAEATTDAARAVDLKL